MLKNNKKGSCFHARPAFFVEENQKRAENRFQITMARFLPKQILVYLACRERAISAFARNFHASSGVEMVISPELAAEKKNVAGQSCPLPVRLAVDMPFEAGLLVNSVADFTRSLSWRWHVGIRPSVNRNRLLAEEFSKPNPSSTAAAHDERVFADRSSTRSKPFATHNVGVLSLDTPTALYSTAQGRAAHPG